MNRLLIIFILFFVFSCNKEIISPVNTKPELTGIWVKQDGKSTVTKTFVKKDTFDVHRFGYAFYEDNKLTVRIKTACGNPPVYGNIQGTYSRSNNDLHLSYKVSGRPNEFNLKIIKLTQDTLVLKY